MSCTCNLGIAGCHWSIQVLQTTRLVCVCSVLHDLRILPREVQLTAAQLYEPLRELLAMLRGSAHEYSARFSCQLAITELDVESPLPPPPPSSPRASHTPHAYNARRHTNVGFAIDVDQSAGNPLRRVEQLRHSLLDQQLNSDITVTPLSPIDTSSLYEINQLTSSPGGADSPRARSHSFSLLERHRKRSLNSGSLSTSRQSLIGQPSPISEHSTDVSSGGPSVSDAVASGRARHSSATARLAAADHVTHNTSDRSHDVIEEASSEAETLTSRRQSLPPPQLQSEVPEFWPMNSEDNLSQPSIDASYDAFENCLSIAQQMDSILSYYYTEESDPETVRVAEIFPIVEPSSQTPREQRASVHCLPTATAAAPSVLHGDELLQKLEDVRRRRRDSV